jgi:NADPH:quinone reductase
MKALLSCSAGGPDTLVLTDVPEPAQPGDDEILLRVKACGVNYPDVLIIEDRYQAKPPRPFAPGSEVSGVVEAAGANVRQLKPGDRVIASTGWGGMTEKILVAANRCTPIPDSISFEQGACLVLAYGTSYHALKDRAKLRAGEKLLVLGAAGGVGIAAIQLGKAMGATVIAAASSEEKVLKAKQHGADIGFVYSSDLDRDRARLMTESLKQLAGPGGMDVIYDPVGGDYAEAALRSIGWQGRYLVIGFPAGIPKLPLNLVLLKGCDVRGVFWGGYVNRHPAEAATTIGELVKLCSDRTIEPLISARFSLERGGDAIASLAGRKIIGKAVVVVN